MGVRGKKIARPVAKKSPVEHAAEVQFVRRRYTLNRNSGGRGVRFEKWRFHRGSGPEGVLLCSAVW